MKRSGLGLVVAGAAVAASALYAPDARAAMTPEQVVAARQAGMDMVGGITESMKNGIAAGLDPKGFEAAAAALVAFAKVYPAMYPDDTKGIANTKAKPEVWSDRAGFEKANAAFVAASEKLVEAAKGGDKAAFAAAFQAEGASCGGCHRGFKNR